MKWINNGTAFAGPPIFFMRPKKDLLQGTQAGPGSWARRAPIRHKVPHPGGDIFMHLYGTDMAQKYMDLALNTNNTKILPHNYTGPPVPSGERYAQSKHSLQLYRIKQNSKRKH